jgi:uncharacterized paraquat-inducible protein A
MYCSNCGAESNEPLKYCKRCGMNLSAPLQSSVNRKFPTLMVFLFLLLIGFVTTMGIVVPLLSAQDLAHAGFGPGSATLIFVVSALVTLGIDSLLVWLLLRLIKIQQQTDTITQSKIVKPPAMRDYSPAQIAAPPEAVGSVTEHTTRNFDQYENLIRSRQSNKDTA